MIRPGNKVLIKPNFVAPFSHAVTSFELLKVIIDEVKQCGGNPIIGESSGFEFDTEATFKILKANEFAARNQVRLVNFDTCKFTNVRLQAGLIKKIKIPELVKQADVLINVPKLKKHSLTGVTIGSKNLFGLLHRESRRMLHSLGLERAIFELARIVKPDLTIVDGSTVAERAVYGDHRQLGLLFAGKNVYAVDMYCCQFLSVNYQDVPHISLALEEGLVEKDFRVRWLGQKDQNRNLHSAIPVNKVSISKKLHRRSYQLMYSFDILYSWVFKKRSLIPKLHFYLGIRPKLNSNKCNNCGECLSACPVKAIIIDQKRIDPSRCMLVRCLKCVQACPESAITIRGREVAGGLTALSAN